MLGTDHTTVLATGEQTDGAIFAVEIRMPPGGGPPVMHRHDPAEIYYVTGGEFAFYLGHPDGPVRRIVAREGDVMPLRGRTPHTVRNEGDVDATAFVVHSPAAVMEGFSRAAGGARGRVPGDAAEHGRRPRPRPTARRRDARSDPGAGMSRVAVVTGATAGIGRAVAVRLAAEGFRVLAVGRDRTRGEAVLGELHAARARAGDAAEHRFLAADLASMAGTAELADEVARHTDRVDALVCCAGIFALRPEWTDEGLERTFALNYLSRFLLVRRLEPLLTASPSGSRRPRRQRRAPTGTVSTSTTRTTGADGRVCGSRAGPSSPTTSSPSSSPSGTGGRRSPRPACSRASCERTCSATVSEYPGPSPPSSRRSRPGWA